jgi:hypothetical protein
VDSGRANPSTAQQYLRILVSMKICGAFLAEKTEAFNNKLNVEGGMICKYRVGPDRTAKFDLAVLTVGDNSDADRLIVIEISPPDGSGQPIHMHRELPANLMTADAGFACFQLRLNLTSNGRWTVAVSGSAGEVALPLIVSGPLPRDR